MVKTGERERQANGRDGRVERKGEGEKGSRKGEEEH